MTQDVLSSCKHFTLFHYFAEGNNSAKITLLTKVQLSVKRIDTNITVIMPQHKTNLS